MSIPEHNLAWFLTCAEPWTRYRTLVDLLARPAQNPDVVQARADLVAHPQVQDLIATAQTWPGYALKRHNDARHPLYALSTLADFGLRHDDPGMSMACDKVLAHQDPQGPFETRLRLYKRFGGMDGDYWSWIACDAPTLTYALVGLGLGDDPRVQRSVEHLRGLARGNGWRCAAAPVLGDFHGPGRREHPCPMATVYALKVLALDPAWADSTAVRQGAEMLLTHWQQRGRQKFYLFGIGTDFCKLKYPLVWYNILHVAEVLSRLPFTHQDARFQEMMMTITAQANADGRYTATSMYRAWQGWSFADKKQPSSWLTFLVTRIQSRMQRV